MWRYSWPIKSNFPFVPFVHNNYENGARTVLYVADFCTSCTPALVREIGAELRPTEIALVGYSLGGRLALAIAARHPDLAARVAVVSGSPGLQGAHTAIWASF
jgi:pimeloyl-ACP methyl ester carboxylesterase